MMNYNIHPILVHFPVALLFLYSIIKVLPLKKWFPDVAWKHIERALLFFGVLGALAADATGSLAQHLVHPNRQLVNAHSTFAGLSTFIYGVLLLGEIIAIINANYKRFVPVGFFQNVLNMLEKTLCHPIYSNLLAIVGFIAISITGLLGGVMVFGLTADPIAGMVVKLLGIHL